MMDHVAMTTREGSVGDLRRHPSALAWPHYRTVPSKTCKQSEAQLHRSSHPFAAPSTPAALPSRHPQTSAAPPKAAFHSQPLCSGCGALE